MKPFLGSSEDLISVEELREKLQKFHHSAIGQALENVVLTKASDISSPTAYAVRPRLVEIISSEWEHASDKTTQLSSLGLICQNLLDVFLQANLTGPAFSRLSATEKTAEERRSVTRQLFTAEPSTDDNTDDDKTSRPPKHVIGESEWDEVINFWRTYSLGHPDDRVGESQSVVITDSDLSRLAEELEIDGDVLSEATKAVGYLWACVQLLAAGAAAFSGQGIEDLQIDTDKRHVLFPISSVPVRYRLLQWRVAFIWQRALSGEIAPSLAKCFIGQFTDLLEKGKVLHEPLALFPSHTPSSSKWQLEQIWRDNGTDVETAQDFISDLSHEEVAMLLVELSIRLTHFGRTVLASRVAEIAAARAGFTFIFDSVMGIKRKYQTTAFAQLVLRVNRCTTSEPVEQEEAPQEEKARAIEEGTGAERADLIGVNAISLSEFEPDTDILEQPRFAKPEQNEGQTSESSLSSGLSDLEYLVLLSLCWATYRSSSSYDELTLEKLRAIVDRCLAPIFAKKLQPNWLIFSCCLWFRSKTEFHRSKTRERAAFQLQALVDQYWDRTPAPAERLKYCMQVVYPFRSCAALELGRVMSRLGSLMTACEMFKEMWLWEEAAECLIASGRKSLALDLVEEQLKRRSTPRLLCCLADIKHDAKLYEEAWALSGNRYTRAQRSLGRFNFLKGDLASAAECYEAALHLNPMFPDVWFTLGCIYMRLQNHDAALNAFSRVVSLSTEDTGEAWSNLGVLHSQKKSWKEACVCIGEAVKQSRDSWRVWDTYIKININADNVGNVILGIRNLIQLSKKANLQDWMFGYISDVTVDLIEANSAGSKFEINKVCDFFEEIVTVHIGDKPAIFDCYARVMAALSDYDKEFDLRCKQLRSTLVSLPEAFDGATAGSLASTLSSVVKDLAVSHRRWMLKSTHVEDKTKRGSTTDLITVLQNVKDRLITANFPEISLLEELDSTMENFRAMIKPSI